jgi:hypothetical protein
MVVVLKTQFESVSEEALRPTWLPVPACFELTLTIYLLQGNIQTYSKRKP